jgi:ABC-type proline/glycine betaine transport system permease subunit
MALMIAIRGRWKASSIRCSFFAERSQDRDRAAVRRVVRLRHHPQGHLRVHARVLPVVVSTVLGFKSVERDMIDLARSMKASSWQTFMRISLPQALPSIFAGLKVSVTLAVVGAVVGEFVGSNSGIGYCCRSPTATSTCR